MSIPRPSKNTSSTVDGSSGAVRAANPELARADRAYNRAMGTGASSKSCTWTPAAFTPTTMARLMMRAVRVTSLDATTTERLGSDVAKAMARRMAISGVTSMLTRPVTPRSPNSPRLPLDSQMML